MQFDPQAFLDMPIDVPFERRKPLPVRAYTATINNVEARPWQSKDKYNADGSPKSGIAYDVALTLEIPLDVQEAEGIKLSQLQLKDSIMLDMNERGGLSTEPGTNNRLRVYREALGMNKPGEVFRARDMIGRMLLVQIKHEEYQGNIQERVGSVAGL